MALFGGALRDADKAKEEPIAAAFHEKPIPVEAVACERAFSVHESIQSILIAFAMA